MEVDPTRMLELLVGLPAVRVLGIADLLPSAPLALHVETRLAGAPDCPGCGGPGRLKDRRSVELVDLPVFARRTRLVWRKRRWCCPAPDCATGSWTETNPLVALRPAVQEFRFAQVHAALEHMLAAGNGADGRA